MNSKFWEYLAKYKMTAMGRRKGTKRPNKSQAYKEATAMSSLSPSIKRVVRYKKTKDK